jgi:hypothetical protein
MPIVIGIPYEVNESGQAPNKNQITNSKRLEIIYGFPIKPGMTNKIKPATGGA